MSAFTGEHSSGPVSRDTQEDITQTTPSMVAPEKDSNRRSSRSRRVQMNRAVLPQPRPNVGRPAEARARWITEHDDDPEKESPQSNDETAEKFAKLHDAEAEGSAVMAELKTHTDKYSAEDVKQALERSQEGIS